MNAGYAEMHIREGRVFWIPEEGDRECGAGNTQLGMGRASGECVCARLGGRGECGDGVKE